MVIPLHDGKRDRVALSHRQTEKPLTKGLEALSFFMCLRVYVIRNRRRNRWRVTHPPTFLSLNHLTHRSLGAGSQHDDGRAERGPIQTVEKLGKLSKTAEWAGRSLANRPSKVGSGEEVCFFSAYTL